MADHGEQDLVRVQGATMDLTTCWTHLSETQKGMCRGSFQGALQVFDQKEGEDTRMHVHHGDDINIIKAFLTLLVQEGFERTDVSFDQAHAHRVVVRGRRKTAGDGGYLYFTFDTAAPAQQVAHQVAAEVLGVAQ